MLNLKIINNTLNAKKRTIKEMFEVFPNGRFEQTSNSYNERNFSSFYVCCPVKEFANKCQKVYVQHEPLFEYGRPKIIEKKYWIWESDFLKISLHMGFPYKYKDGVETISLTYGSHLGISYGLKDWNSKKKEIKSIMNGNKNLQKEYLEKINDADKEIKKWKEAINNITIPV